MWRKKGYVSITNAFIILFTFFILFVAFVAWAILDYFKVKFDNSEPKTNIVQGETVKQNDVYKKILQGPKIFRKGEVER